MTVHTILVGPGWLGAPTATALATTGQQVITLARSAREAPPRCAAVTGNITEPESLRAVLPATVQHVVVCVAPSGARGDSYAIYPAAARGAAELAAMLQARSLVYISSTGIYDRHDGSAVDEDTPLTPATDRVQALADAESTILAANSASCHAMVLRAAGLYGPGRDPAARFRDALVARDSWCNFSWRDDVTVAIAHLQQLAITAPERLGARRLFNCTDNTPVTAGAITDALTGVRGATPAADAGAGQGHATGPVRAGRSNQRISSAALMATGWTPLMPTVFDGLEALGHALPGDPRPGHAPTRTSHSADHA
jgi:nucleoside-diphosphate-sugar epimerase